VSPGQIYLAVRGSILHRNSGKPSSQKITFKTFRTSLDFLKYNEMWGKKVSVFMGRNVTEFVTNKVVFDGA